MAFRSESREKRPQSVSSPGNNLRHSDTMAKREDPSHYTNDLFQPNVWHPNLKHGRESSGKASSPGKAI